MNRAERIKKQEERVALAAKKLRDLRAAEKTDQRKARTHALIQIGAIIEVVGIPIDTSKDVLTGAWAKVAELIREDPQSLANFAIRGQEIIAARLEKAAETDKASGEGE